MKSFILSGAAAVALAGPAIAQAPGAHAGHAGGNISRADATVMVTQLFARVDLNKDGKITREEMQAARQQFAQSRPGGKPEGQAPSGGARGGAMGMYSGFGPDGTITLEQARATALQHFDRMDADRNGTLTQIERQAMREGMHRMMEQGMGSAKPKAKAKPQANGRTD